MEQYNTNISENVLDFKRQKLKGQLPLREELYGKSAKAAAKVEKNLVHILWILPSSGRYMAVAGRKGHIAVVDMNNMNLVKEIQVREIVRDVVFLHNELFFAAAQKKYPYFYNGDGTELHCSKASRTDLMRVNPFNGVVSLGHSGGTVTMWKPTTSALLIKMLYHQGPVSALAFHPNGHLMATTGKECKIKIWDLRKYEVLQTLTGHAKTLDFSQKGLLAVGTGSFAQILGDFSGSHNYSRYMGNSMVKGYQIGKVSFRPYEDVLGIGHSMGWSGILVPRSSEPNFDSWVANPFETSKQRREKEVHSLLDKLLLETIMLNPSKIGTVREAKKKEKPTKQGREAEMEAAVEAIKGFVWKNKTKGRNKPSKKAKKKQELIAHARRPFLDQQLKEEQSLSKKKQKLFEEVELPASLRRFARKKPTA
ncbi:WD REPEATS REGION domain-containing protein [Citrus sinensis]|nr:WD REPEATS REGION domain-containing protein [Citrus sinensis]